MVNPYRSVPETGGHRARYRARQARRPAVAVMPATSLAALRCVSALGAAALLLALRTVTVWLLF